MYRRVGKFRQDLQEMKVRFEAVKKQQETLRNDQNRDSLLRRSNRGSGPSVVSYMSHVRVHF
jgi:Golgi SNAP receptor complex protein 2